MIIEFLGVSGAGKTTSAKKIKLLYEKNGHCITWDTYELYSNHGWLERNIIKVIYVFSFSFKNFSWVKKYYVFLRKRLKICSIAKLFFNGIYLKLMLDRARCDNNIHLFDEGVLQHLWAIKLRECNNIDVNDLIHIKNIFGLPEMVYYIDAEPEKIYYRLLHRNEYTRILAEKDIMSKIVIMRTQCEDMLNILPNLSKNIIIKRIDNNSEDISLGDITSDYFF